MTELKHCTVCGKELYYRAKSTRCKAHQPGPAPMPRGPYRPPLTPDVRDTPDARRYEGAS